MIALKASVPHEWNFFVYFKNDKNESLKSSGSQAEIK